MSFIKFLAETLLCESIDVSNYSYVSHLGGSTGADLYQAPDGSKWVFKKGAHANHMYNEYVSNKLYDKFGKALGLKVPQAFIGDFENDKDVFVMQYLDGSIPFADAPEDSKQDLVKGFILDVLFANWDVLGTDYSLDNVRYWKGEFYRVDLGGSLLYRAMGGAKGGQFTDVPGEQTTLPRFNDIFSSIGEKQIKEQLKQLLQPYVQGNMFSIRGMLRELKSAIMDEDNMLSEQDKQQLYSKISRRCYELAKMFKIKDA